MHQVGKQVYIDRGVFTARYGLNIFFSSDNLSTYGRAVSGRTVIVREGGIAGRPMWT